MLFRFILSSLTLVYLSNFCNMFTEEGMVTTPSLDFRCQAFDSYDFGTGG